MSLPPSRDTLSRGFLIEKEITHAKDAKDAKEDWLLGIGVKPRKKDGAG